MTLSRITQDPPDPLLWVRPTDWPALPTVLASEHKFTGLYKIENHDMNYVAFSFTQGSGTYHVDWGDGTNENVSSGGAAVHQYTYSDTDLSGPTSEGFKCAVITVTPNGGLGFNAMSLNLKHSSLGSASNWSSGWLDIRMSTPGITGALTNMAIGNGSSVIHRNCRQFEYIGTHGVTSGTNFFIGFIALESLKVPSSFTSTFTQVATMFSGCTRLRYIPDLDTHAVTNFTSMFANCTLLKRVPDLDYSAATTMSSVFQNCTALEYIPDIGSIGNTTTTSSLFAGCASLKAAPAIISNSSLVTTTNMFLNCAQLRTIPVFNTSGMTNAASMFQGCSVLPIVPAFDFSAVLSGNFTNIFNTCTGLSKILATGAKFGHTIATQLSSAALDVYYTNLGTASGAQTLVVTGNQVTSDTPSIATAKGWTVTGS